MIAGNDHDAVDIGEDDVAGHDEDVAAADGASVVDHGGAGGGIDGTKPGAKDRETHLQNALHIARVAVDEATGGPPGTGGGRQQFAPEAGAL